VLAAGSTGAVVNSENLSALYGRAIDVAEVVSPDGVERRTCIARLHTGGGSLAAAFRLT
jgi:hypothetical protein